VFLEATPPRLHALNCVARNALRPNAEPLALAFALTLPWHAEALAKAATLQRIDLAKPFVIDQASLK
jgi:multisubunit Na+/H+ antiporter MnhG subunit